MQIILKSQDNIFFNNNFFINIWLLIKILIKQFKFALVSKNLCLFFFLKIFSQIVNIELVIKHSLSKNKKYYSGNNKFLKIIEFKLFKKFKFNITNNEEIMILLFVLNRRFFTESMYYLRILKKLNLQNNHEIIEIGCGPSFFISEVASILGYKYTGIDHSPFSINAAKLINKNIKLIVNDIEKITLEDNKIYLGNSVLNHLKDHKKLIKRIVNKKSIYIFIEDKKLINLDNNANIFNLIGLLFGLPII